MPKRTTAVQCSSGMKGLLVQVDTRAGHYTKGLHTKAGEATLKIAKLRSLPFEMFMIERYRRREASAEEDITEALLMGEQRQSLHNKRHEPKDVWAH